MPKRVIHGEGVWGSDKLAHAQPEWVRPEYANMIPLALANGVFEVNAKRIWSCVYSYNRPEITIEKVEIILESFKEAGLLFIWNDQISGKAWGFWTGIDKAGRLPSASRLKKGHDAVGPTPPPDALAKYTKQPMASQWLTNDQVGSGSGFGSGSGKTISSEPIGSDEEVSESPQKAKAVPSKVPSSAGIALARLLRERILQNNPNAKITDNGEHKWAVEADRMILTDNRTAEQIRELIDFSQADSFWLTNILSMATLREKFDQLWLKRKVAVNPAVAVVPIAPKRLTVKETTMPNRRNDMVGEEAR